MDKINKCPKCGGQMRRCIILDAIGKNGDDYERPKWGDGTKLITGDLVPFGDIQNFRCISCGYLESYAK